jgi:hypothetical protein
MENLCVALGMFCYSVRRSVKERNTIRRQRTSGRAGGQAAGVPGSDAAPVKTGRTGGRAAADLS